jgi:hypothetical protein
MEPTVRTILRNAWTQAAIAILLAALLTWAISTGAAYPDQATVVRNPGERYQSCFAGTHNSQSECMLIGMGGILQRPPQK